jgi:hypothetical protein
MVEAACHTESERRAIGHLPRCSRSARDVGEGGLEEAGKGWVVDAAPTEGVRPLHDVFPSPFVLGQGTQAAHDLDVFGIVNAEDVVDFADAGIERSELI